MGFWGDVRELRELIDEQVRAGASRDALSEAVRKQAAQPKTSKPKKRPYKKIFLISFLAGALWQGSKRSR